MEKFQTSLLPSKKAVWPLMPLMEAHYEKQAHTQLVPHVGHFLMPLT